MSFRHYSSSISSETSDDIINRRLRSFVYRNSYYDDYDFMSRYGECLSYSKDKRRRQQNDIINQRNLERRSRSTYDGYSDISSEDEDFHRNLSPLRIDRYNHPSIDVYRACQVTLIYKKDNLSSNETDEILIKQKLNHNDKSTIVYKGYLKKDDTFSFKSQHYSQYNFHIKFYINGYFDTHLSTCCEYKYRQGDFHLSQSFIIQHVEKAIPCQRCQRHQKKDNQEVRTVSSNRKKALSDDKSSKNTQRINNDEEQKQENNIDENNNHHENSTIKSEMISSPSVEKKEEEEEEEENVKSEEEENVKSEEEENVKSEEEENVKSEEEENVKSEEETNGSKSEDNSSNQFRRMLMERPTANNGNSGGFFQSLLSLLQNGFRRVVVPEPLPLRHEGNVENFVVILFGIEDKSDLFRSIINFVKTFSDIEQLNQFIETLKVERILLVVNDELFESISNPSRFNSIYILSNKKSSSNDLNIRGYFSNIELILEGIKDECSIEKDLISIELNEKANQSFIYSQLLKEIILTKDNDSNLKKDFIDYCRLHYNNNTIQLNLIEQFEKDFSKETCIRWYTRNTFLRKMIQRGLRTQEIDILYKMRWVIQIINQQIKEKNLLKTVYRIHYFTLEDFEKLKENQSDGLISFGNFIDCTLNKPSFIENIKEMKTILFEIETINGIETEQIRYSDSKTEVLLSYDNIYHIESIEENENNFCIINLKEINTDLTNELRQKIESPIILIKLGKLLLSNNNYSNADYLARLLFNDGSIKDNPTLLSSLAALHHLLGSFHIKQNNYRAARLQFEESLKIFLTFIPEENQILSATYNNIGSMFYQEDNHEQAIIYHQKALQCQLKSSSPDINAIATYSANIAAVYLDQSKYDQALLNYKRSLHVLQQSTPNQQSKEIAVIYDRIASVYWRMDKPSDALQFYQLALQLELKYLADNDHKISVSYFNLSTAYAKLNKLDDAIHCAEKSIQQLLKTVPNDHPEVKENTQQLEGLRRRKWIQQLHQ